MMENNNALNGIRSICICNLEERYRLALAKRTDTAPDILQELARDSNPKVRRCVADNQTVPAETLAELARDGDESVRDSTARNPVTPVDVLTTLANETSGVASNPSTPPSILERLYHEDKGLSSYIAGNPSAPPSLLERIVLHDYRNTTPRFDFLTRDLGKGGIYRDKNVGERAARNPSMPVDTLMLLMNEGCIWTYRYVACNRNASRDTLSELSEMTMESLEALPGFGRFVDAGTEDWVRQNIHRFKEDEPFSSSSLQYEYEFKTYEKGVRNGVLFEILYNVVCNPSTPDDVLKRFARGDFSLELAENPNTSPDILAMCARDVRYYMENGIRAMPEALAANPNTPYLVLLDLSSPSPSMLSAAVAGNPSAPPGVLRRLTDSTRGTKYEWAPIQWHWFKQAVKKVAANPNAPEDVLRLIMENNYPHRRYDRDAQSVLYSLASNPSTPPDILEELAWEKDGALLNPNLNLINYLKHHLEVDNIHV